VAIALIAGGWYLCADAISGERAVDSFDFANLLRRAERGTTSDAGARVGGAKYTA